MTLIMTEENEAENEADREAREALSRKKDINILILSTAMFTIFTGYFTIAATSVTIVRSYTERTGNVINGFVSFGVLHSVAALSSPLAPVMISLVGRRCTMFIGALLQTSYIYVYINPIPALYYTFSGLAGLGATLIWIGMVGCNLVLFNYNLKFLRGPKQAKIQLYTHHIETTVFTGVYICQVI